MLWYFIIGVSVLCKNVIAVFNVKVIAKLRISINVCPDDIVWTAEQFVTKRGTAMHLSEPECHAKSLVRCLQGQGYDEG